MFRNVLALLFLLIAAAGGSAQTVVTGKVLGAHGKPMIRANYFLRQPFDTATVRAGDVAKDGSFSLIVPSNGVWLLTLTGVHHAGHAVGLYIESRDPVEVNVRLTSYTYLKDFDDVRAFGSFNNWYNLTAVPLRKEAGGEYIAKIRTKAPSISYMLANVRYGGSVEGTQPAEYAYRWSQGYESIIPAKDGIATIVFNPDELVRSSEPAKVKFVHVPGVVERFSEIYNELVQYQDNFKFAFRGYMASRARMPHKVFSFDFSKPISRIREQIQTEKDPVLRSELYFVLLALHVMNQASDPPFYTKVLQEIDPASLVWSLEPHDIFFALTHSGLSEQKRDEYVGKVLDENPIKRVKSALLYDEFMSSKMKEDKKRSDYYYDLITGRFGDTPEGRRVAKYYTPYKALLSEGSMVPSFSVASMGDAGKLITDKSLLGKYYLIEFWASEDPRSAEQIKYLNSAYEAYKNQGFGILTLSVDSSYSDVTRFRKIKWEMPWLNAYLGRNRDDPMVKAFRVYQIPKAFLVSPKGVIVAMGEKLLGVELDRTLKKYIGH